MNVCLDQISFSKAFRECEQETEAMSAKERYEYSLKMGTNHFRTAFKLARETGSLDDLALISYLGRSVLTPEGSPLSLHTAMFIPALRGQASKEQADYWLTRALNMDIIGTYAQTELGHGTFLRGLETTATYDTATEEFVLHSPSTSAYKWWPGGLGKTANHAVVMCQLVINGERKGPHPFIVQLRDMETHTSLMGIDVSTAAFFLHNEISTQQRFFNQSTDW